MADPGNTTPIDLDGVYCPTCGYDLRASLESERVRCPECGDEFARAALSRSRVPWMHRNEIGRLKAWWFTCWMAIRRPRDLAISLNSPMPYPDARKFWIICAAIAAIPGVIAAWGSPESAGTPIVNTLWGRTPGGIEAVALNVLAPWAAGWYLRPVSMPCAALATFAATGSVSCLFHFAPLPRKLQDRAAAAGLYTSGAMISGAVLALPLALLKYHEFAWAVFNLLVPVATIAWLIATWQAYRRISRAGVGRSVLAGMAIVLMTLLSYLFALGFVPWCIGVCRIFIGAFQA